MLVARVIKFFIGQKFSIFFGQVVIVKKLLLESSPFASCNVNHINPAFFFNIHPYPKKQKSMTKSLY